jgi:uracil-DNA glycosylase family 4
MNLSEDKQQKLEQIKADILEQNICPDLAKSAKNLVMGDGNADADIVFIGEAPGKNEDEQGLPFVGAAGKFLNEMLATIGLERSDIYITNIVKYRPPNNRDPLPEEKAAFLPFLQAQLDVIRPKIIVTLGRHSMDSLLPGLQISKVHGQPKRIRVKSNEYRATNSQGSGLDTHDSQVVKTWVIMPLFHPAAALYNGAMRQTLIDDFAKIPEVLSKIEEKINNLDK